MPAATSTDWPAPAPLLLWLTWASSAISAVVWVVITFTSPAMVIAAVPAAEPVAEMVSTSSLLVAVTARPWKPLVVPRVDTRWPLRAWLSLPSGLLAAGALISPSSVLLAV